MKLINMLIMSTLEIGKDYLTIGLFIFEKVLVWSPFSFYWMLMILCIIFLALKNNIKNILWMDKLLGEKEINYIF